MSDPLVAESQNIWLDKWRYDDAETNYHIVRLGGSVPAKQQIHSSGPVDNNILVSRLEGLELDNKELRQVTADLQAVVKKLESRIAALECASGKPCSENKEEKPVSKNQETGGDEDEDDFSLFGSDEEEDDDAERIKAERIKEYESRKAKKTAVIAKSNVIMDVKPWDDETDMAIVEKCVRSIEMDGLLWGTSRLVPVGYGIKKLTISCVVEDEKVSIVDLEDKILEFEEYIQSMDVAAFNKL